ncbi:MAG: PDZ domain-containing protein [archaeon]
MASKAKEIFTNWRVILLILLLLASYASINPKFKTEGVSITAVATNSSAEINGVQSGATITEINGQKVANMGDYSAAVAKLQNGTIAKYVTSKQTYSFPIELKDNATYTGITVKEIPTSNLKQGLDLIGGVRVLLKPEEQLSAQQMSDVVEITRARLNTFGLTDMNIRQVKDLQGNSFILVELAGATQEEATNLISKQGKFEAKIGNDTVFVGGVDIKAVGRSAQEGAGIRTCNQADAGWVCQFMFPVTVSTASAEKHAAITSRLATINVGSEVYLEKKLDMYLDDNLVNSLYISSSLKGKVTTTFSIEGSGSGNSREAAFNNALTDMKELQTVLITGSLPVKLSIAKIDVVSPILGQAFLQSAIIALVAAIAAVGVVVFIRYRRLKITLPIMITGLCEIFIIFGMAALIKQNLDLAAIAGVLAAVGTGVDAQLVITDEVLTGVKRQIYNWKEHYKNAFFIIMGSFSTVVAAMIPLLWVGAGALKGFAIVTIIGVSIGVFVTRPAYARIVEVLLK